MEPRKEWMWIWCRSCNWCVCICKSSVRTSPVSQISFVWELPNLELQTANVEEQMVDQKYSQYFDKFGSIRLLINYLFALNHCTHLRPVNETTSSDNVMLIICLVLMLEAIIDSSILFWQIIIYLTFSTTINSNMVFLINITIYCSNGDS